MLADPDSDPTQVERSSEGAAETLSVMSYVP